MKVPARALSVFCPHCQKRASLEDLVIVGSHPGKALMTCGDIRIEASARLHVEVLGNRVIVHGRVKGGVTANESVEVGRTGHVLGDIKAPKIVVRDGGVIEGRCEMTISPVVTAAIPESQAASRDELSEQQPPPTINMPRPRPLAPPRSNA